MTNANRIGLVPAAIFASATAVCGEVTIQVTTVPINTTLEANGWIGYLLTLHSDLPTMPIAAVEMKNPTDYTTGRIGLSGTFHQAWVMDVVDSGYLLSTPTAVSIAPVVVDSAFLNPSRYLMASDYFYENSNLLNGTNPPYTRSPLIDKPSDAEIGKNGVDYGVGSTMTVSAFLPNYNYSTDLDLAVIVVPADPANGYTFFNAMVLTFKGYGEPLPHAVTEIIGIDRAAPPRSPASLHWTGSADGATWDYGMKTNWSNSGSADAFYDKDHVIFDDEHNVGGNRTVVVDTPLAPGSITINSASDYTLTGRGFLYGSGSLTKAGSGTLVLALEENAWTGTTYLQEGTLKIGARQSTPAGGKLVFGDASGHSAILDLNGHDLTIQSLSVAGGANNQIGNSSSTLSTLTLRWCDVSLPIHDGVGPIGGQVSVILDGTKLRGPQTYTGETIMGGAEIFGPIASHKVTVAELHSNNRSYIYQGFVQTDVELTVDSKLILAGSNDVFTIRSLYGTSSSGSLTFATTSLNTTLNVTHGGSYAGSIIAQTGPLTINAGENLLLTGTLTGNIHFLGDITLQQSSNTDTTTVSSGKLIISGSIYAPLVIVDNGAIIGGVGVIYAPLNVNGILAPGNSPGTLSMADKLTFGSDSILLFDLGLTATSDLDTDLIHFTTLGNSLFGSGNVTLNLMGTADYTETYTLFDNTDTPDFTFAGIQATGLANYDPGYSPLVSFDPDSHSYLLTFTPTNVPEPASLLLLAPLLTAITLRRRR